MSISRDRNIRCLICLNQLMRFSGFSLYTPFIFPFQSLKRDCGHNFKWWHGKASPRKRLNTETDQKLFLRHFRFFRNLRKSLKSSELLRDFRIFCIRFPIFRVEWFTLFFDQFPHICMVRFLIFFDPFPLFSKTLKISFCWSVSSNIRSVSLLLLK